MAAGRPPLPGTGSRAGGARPPAEELGSYPGSAHPGHRPLCGSAGRGNATGSITCWSSARASWLVPEAGAELAHPGERVEAALLPLPEALTRRGFSLIASTPYPREIAQAM